MNIAILLPTIYRKDGLLRTLKSLFDTTKGYIDYLTVVIAHEWDDRGAIEVSTLYNGRVIRAVCRMNKQGPAYAWNTALQHAQFFDAYFTASDDIEFMPDWLDEVLKVHGETNKGLIGINEGTGKFNRAGFCTHYFMTRNFIVNVNGGVVYCPHYQADYMDVEIIERATKLDEFAYAKEARIIHHWRETDDEAYKRGQQRRYQSREMFMMRKANNFPNDYKAIIE